MEHFGIAVREALSAGVPTVVYELPPFDDIRSHPCLFEVPLGSVQDLSKALALTLSLTPIRRGELSAASKSFKVGPTWSDAATREWEIISDCATQAGRANGSN
jgi:glycosyltransferase involved in cell wall biosynthesis